MAPKAAERRGLAALSAPDLRERLRNLGHNTTGNRSELLERYIYVDDEAWEAAERETENHVPAWMQDLIEQYDEEARQEEEAEKQRAAEEEAEQQRQAERERENSEERRQRKQEKKEKKRLKKEEKEKRKRASDEAAGSDDEERIMAEKVARGRAEEERQRQAEAAVEGALDEDNINVLLAGIELSGGIEETGQLEETGESRAAEEDHENKSDKEAEIAEEEGHGTPPENDSDSDSEAEKEAKKRRLEEEEEAKKRKEAEEAAKKKEEEAKKKAAAEAARKKEEEEARRKAEEEDTIAPFVLKAGPWKKRSVKSLVKALYEVGEIKKEDIPTKPSEVSPQALRALRRKWKETVDMPLERYARQLKPALFRRVHVGTMSEMDECHEYYRQKFEFLEVTNSWHDYDVPWRKIPKHLQTVGAKYMPPSVYDDLARRAADGFKVVIKVSCVATHMRGPNGHNLANFKEWWPILYNEKYSKLKSATVAFLWQFPPSFRYDWENHENLEALAEYLHSSESGCPEARHIVDFRSETWYVSEVYEFLKQKRWCLAWLHLNNEPDENGGKWASDLPSGWTDRVRTTNFCFMRLFGPSGRTHGRYNKRFLHELFNSCPEGATSYVLFGNREELDDENPNPRPALVNANDFRTIFTKMDFIERIRSLKYIDPEVVPRRLSKKEMLLLNSFYIRFSRRARMEGVQMRTPAVSTLAQKYYAGAPPKKRSFEWRNMPTNSHKETQSLHLSLHEAKEDEDLWKVLRNLTGVEDLEATKEWVKLCIERRKLEFKEEETKLVNGAFLRWSESGRQAGLLSTTKLESVRPDGTVCWNMSNGAALKLNIADLDVKHDCWSWFADLARAPSVPESIGANVEFQEDESIWKDDAWVKESGNMWTQEFEACADLRGKLPDAYSAAGLIYYSRNARGEISRLLLGIEERKMDNHELGAGEGSSSVAVLVFPQGKIEAEKDENDYVKTAKREFLEETGDSTGLLKYVKDKEEADAVWFQDAKMMIIWCEVPSEASASNPKAYAKKPLKPMWVEAAQLKEVLVAKNSAKIKTELGSFPLFPMTRNFLNTAEARQRLDEEKLEKEGGQKDKEKGKAKDKDVTSGKRIHKDDKFKTPYTYQEFVDFNDGDEDKAWKMWQESTPIEEFVAKNLKQNKWNKNELTQAREKAPQARDKKEDWYSKWDNSKKRSNFWEDEGRTSWKKTKTETADNDYDEPPKLGQWKVAFKDSAPKVWDEWQRWESNEKPGKFMYRNTETNETTLELPPALQDTWERRDDLYYNKDTGEAQEEAPPLP